MAENKTPPFRAEHVGSFPRPERLVKARDDHAAGKLTLADLRKVEDEAVREVVAMQERVGVGAITDGEFRRTSWRDAPFEHFDGFTKERYEADFTFRLFDGSTRKAGPVPSVTAKLRRATPMTADTFEMLKGMTKKLPKANLPTPSVIAPTPTRSCMATTSRTASSSILRSSARVSFPAAWSSRALTSLSGRGNEPTCSARNGGVLFSAICPIPKLDVRLRRCGRACAPRRPC